MEYAEFDANELITPSAAIELIIDKAGNAYPAKMMIADAIHNGDVIVYASRVFDVEDTDACDDWADLIAVSTLYSKNLKVPGSMWTQSSHWPDETRHWNWKRGNFLLHYGYELHDGLCGWLLENVQCDGPKSLLSLGPARAPELEVGQ